MIHAECVHEAISVAWITYNGFVLTKSLGGTCVQVVIIVEGTGGIEFLLPVILAIVLSNWVAHYIHSAGAYESDLERIGEVHFLQSEPSQRLNFITARDIMAPDVICFKEVIIILRLKLI